MALCVRIAMSIGGALASCPNARRELQRVWPRRRKASPSQRSHHARHIRHASPFQRTANLDARRDSGELWRVVGPKWEAL